MKEKVIKGVVVNPKTRTKKGAEIVIVDGRITKIIDNDSIHAPFILPGFVDAHVHIESSMLIPSQFSVMAVKQGTVAVVTDPHEVANVAGISGIRFMIENAKTADLKFFFGVPSCVPASPLEKSGAVIDADAVEKLIKEPDFHYLAEMMNYPGVIYNDTEVINKINAAKRNNKPIDGHAPSLNGDMLRKYVEAGISTDHECSSINEAEEKISLGMKILVREGSAAKNFETLIPLLKKFPKSIMFCTDDCHPDYLEKGHINKLVARAVKAGYDLFDSIASATLNPIEHYKLPVGKLVINDPADFVIVNNLSDFSVLETYINGENVFNNNKDLSKHKVITEPSFPFRISAPKGKLAVKATGNSMNIIGAIDGELITSWIKEKPEVSKNNEILANPDKDLLKIVLLDRYSEADPVVGFIRGFGLKEGAIAASIAHDSHHVISIGCDDQSIEASLDWIVKARGGICFTNSNLTVGIRLPFFGLMANEDGRMIAKQYLLLNEEVKKKGCSLSSPFMTASFMALTVIPELKIFHRGLFDGNSFKQVDLFNS